jgi:formamidopyrimidine-DNA glycosylase
VPELVEVEAYRQLAERSALGREIAAVDTPDGWYLKGGTGPGDFAMLIGCRLTVARRRGKLLMLDTDLGAGEPGPVLGLRFGMTGRLLVDDDVGVDELRHSSTRDNRAWDRFALGFADGGRLAVRDPRRLGGVMLDPGEDRLGPDAATATPAQLRAALGGSRVALKARLMDQTRLAGVGNLIADEALWRAGLAPGRPAGSLSAPELRRLHRHLAATVADLGARGGSHTGDLMAQRCPGGNCPRDGEPLRRDRVGGRTTWWCPRHQT